MKLKSLYIAGLAALIVTSAASCHREFLDPSPENSLILANAFSTPSRISSQVLGLYATMKNGAFYGGRFTVYGDIRGEEFLAQDPNLVTNYDVWALVPTNTATAVRGLWLQAYQTINACNMFLDGMDSVGTAVVGTALSNNYKAEARLIRAISFYSLLQFYARPYADGNGSKLGLPLRLKGIYATGSSDLARSTVAQTYAQIIADLDYAETNLPSTNSTSSIASNNVTRAHKNTAISFKTRVYLSMQKYDKVIDEANKIVPAISLSGAYAATSGVKDSLIANYADIFKTPYISAESILSMPFTTASNDVPGTQNDVRSYYYNKSSSGTFSSIYSLNTAGIIANAQFTSTDKRRAFVETASTGKVYLSKFPNSSAIDYIPVMRWAEVLLNLAEARARNTTSVDAQAIDLLNAVHRRSDASTTYTAANFATYTDLVNTILTERRIEFLGEGLRNNDLMRLLQTIPAKGVVGTRTPTDDGYTWPASSDEKSLNKLWQD